MPEPRQRGWSRRRTRNVATLGAVGVIVLVTLTVGVDLLALRDISSDLRVEVQRLRRAATTGDLEAIDQSVQGLQDLSTLGADHVDGPVWATLAAVPGLGNALHTTRDAIHVSESAAAILAEATNDVLGPLLEPSGGLTADGAVNTPVLVSSSDAAADIDTSVLESRLSDLRNAPTSFTPGAVQDVREALTTHAADLLTVVEMLGEGPRLAASFLGHDGPRTYVLAPQNSGELRGTGGFLGIVGALRVHEGRVELLELRKHNDITDWRDPWPGVSGPDTFVDRYRHAGSTAKLGNVNIDPNLPTVGPVLADIIEARTPFGAIDGVIAIDPVGIDQLLRGREALEIVDATGDVQRVPIGQVARTSLQRVYQKAPSDPDAQDRFLGELAFAALERLLEDSENPTVLIQHLADATAERHLQVFSRTPDEQALFERLGVAGELLRSEPGERVDELAITAVNSAGNKMDSLVAHATSITIELSDNAPGPLLRRYAEVTTAVQNPTEPGDRTPQLATSRGIAVLNSVGDFTEPGISRTWFTAWLPPDTSRTVIPEGAPITALGDAARLIHGRRPIDYLVEVEPSSHEAMAFAYDGVVELTPAPGGLRYQFEWWRQAKAVPDVLDITIVAPDGWTIRSSAIQGGGSGRGLGVAGDAGRVKIERSGGSVRVTGGVTRDLLIEVVLQPQ